MMNEAQLRAVSIIERTCSVFSLMGSLFIITTFLTSRSFNKPINRLVFYCSFGNIMTNIGTLMSRSYNDSPDSVGCQFQSFLIQMFMPADAFWTLAMAINVYLTFYYKFDAKKLRRMEIPYLLICYGVPLIPATVYVFLRNSNGQRVYGNATLWCWVVPEWGLLRIVTFYGPVWIVILLTFFIYIRAGRTIYEKRRQLYDFSYSDNDPISINGEVISTVKTTEVKVTTEIINRPHTGNMESRGRYDSDTPADGRNDRGAAYSITISADADPFGASHLDDRIQPSAYRGDLPRHPTTNARRRNYEVNNAAWAYTKCAILFFTALLITWIPSSANRVYSFVHVKKSSMPLEFMSAFVLPLQGWWNAVIYIVTSWRACKNLREDWQLGRRTAIADLFISKPLEESPQQRSLQLSQFRSTARASPKSYETESMTELAHTRDTSEDRGQV